MTANIFLHYIEISGVYAGVQVLGFRCYGSGVTVQVLLRQGSGPRVQVLRCVWVHMGLSLSFAASGAALQGRPRTGHVETVGQIWSSLITHLSVLQSCITHLPEVLAALQNAPDLAVCTMYHLQLSCIKSRSACTCDSFYLHCVPLVVQQHGPTYVTSQTQHVQPVLSVQ